LRMKRLLRRRTLSPEERTLALVGVLTTACALTIVVAAVVIGNGTGRAGVTAPVGVQRVATPTGPVPVLAEDRSDSRPRVESPKQSKRDKKAADRRPTRKSPQRKPSTPPAEAEEADQPYVSIRPASTWDDGFVAVVRIINPTDEPLPWEISFELRDADIENAWQAELDDGDGTIVARGLDYNAVIAPRSWVEFGFVAEGTDRPQVDDCLINGEPCRAPRS